MTELINGPKSLQPGELLFADGLGTLAKAIQENLAEEVHSLDFIVSAAVDLIPGVESAAVTTLASKARLAARSVSGDLAGPVLDAQNDTGEGPCFEVAQDVDQILVTDVRSDDRWPRFADVAAPSGVRSLVCTALTGDKSVRGSLSLHSTVPDAFDDESRELARVFAAHASIALAGAARHRNIVAALGSRDVIGQAKGILMERFGITAAAAFAVLLRMSQHLNIKLRSVCEELCSSGVLLGTTELRRTRGGAGRAAGGPGIVQAAVARTGGTTTGPVAGAPQVDGVAVEAVSDGSRDEDVIIEAAMADPDDPGTAARAASLHSR